MTSWAFLGEPLGWAKAVGVGLLVVALALVNRIFEGSGAKASRRLSDTREFDG